MLVAAVDAASKCKSKLRISTFLHYHFYPITLISLHSPNRFQGFSSALSQPRNYRVFSSIKSLPVGVSWIWPFFACKYLSTQISSSEETLEEMLNQILSLTCDSSISIDEKCFSYINKLCNSENVVTAAKLVQSLRFSGVHLSSRVYNRLLKAANEHNRIDILSQTFKELLTSPNPISSTSYNILAKSFSVLNDEFILKFIKEISDSTFPISATIFNRIIYAFSECGEVDKALLIFNEMKSLKCKPDLFTYNTIIGILGKCGKIDEMLNVFLLMEEANFVPDIVTYNTILNSLRKIGRLDLCIVYFNKMLEQGVEPDLRTYTALIESYGRSGNIEESLRLFEEMKCRRICPSIYIYRSLIQNLKKVGKLERANGLLKEMNECMSNLVGPKDFKRKDR